MLLSWHLEAALQELYLKIYTYCNKLKILSLTFHKLWIPWMFSVFTTQVL